MRVSRELGRVVRKGVRQGMGIRLLLLGGSERGHRVVSVKRAIIGDRMSPLQQVLRNEI